MTMEAARPRRTSCGDPAQTMHSPLDSVVERDGRRVVLAIPQFFGLKPFEMELAHELAFGGSEDAHALRFRQKLF